MLATGTVFRKSCGKQPVGCERSDFCLPALVFSPAKWAHFNPFPQGSEGQTDNGCKELTEFGLGK